MSSYITPLIFLAGTPRFIRHTRLSSSSSLSVLLALSFHVIGPSVAFTYSTVLHTAYTRSLVAVVIVLSLLCSACCFTGVFGYIRSSSLYKQLIRIRNHRPSIVRSVTKLATESKHAATHLQEIRARLSPSNGVLEMLGDQRPADRIYFWTNTEIKEDPRARNPRWIPYPQTRTPSGCPGVS